MNFIFKTPCLFDGEGFGCASFGFSGAPDPAKEGIRSFGNVPEGECFFGELDELLEKIPEKSGKGNWQAGIVLFGNCGGENAFIRKLSEKVSCPLAGGAAACDPVTGKSGLVSGFGQAAVYMICDPAKKITVEAKNIHTNILGEYNIGFTDPRVPETIDGEDALGWFAKKRAEYGFSENDFEHMTLSDMNNINAHMSVSDGRLISGRDLCRTMLLRYVKPGDVYPQMREFYDDKDAMVFGCAGLKGILEQDIMTDGTGLFLFGEVVTLDGVSNFGNLMLSKIVIKDTED